jgi:hypothetical protein
MARRDHEAQHQSRKTHIDTEESDTTLAQSRERMPAQAWRKCVAGLLR